MPAVNVTGRHYDQYDRLREKRRSLELWSEQIQSIIDGAPASNVVFVAAGEHFMNKRAA